MISNGQGRSVTMPLLWIGAFARPTCLPLNAVVVARSCTAACGTWFEPAERVGAATGDPLVRGLLERKAACTEHVKDLHDLPQP